MMKKYRALAVLAVAYGIAASIYPDYLLPFQEQITAIFDGISNAVDAGES